MKSEKGKVKRDSFLSLRASIRSAAILLSVALLVVLGFAAIAHAQCGNPTLDDTGQLVCYFSGWYYNLILPAGTILAGAMIAWGGIMYAQSGGDPEKVKMGKEYIFGAISGLALLITAALIVRTITG